MNRYYDPSTDSFISVDPAVQSTDQPYVFVNSDPLNVTDPFGLCIREPSGGCAISSTSPTIQKAATLKKSTVIGSTPYFGVPAIETSNTVLIPAGNLDYAVSASASFQGPNSDTGIAVEPNGNVDVSAGRASATISPNGAMSNVGVTGINTASYSRSQDVGTDRVTTTISVTLQPGTYPDGGLYAAGGLLLWVLRPIVTYCVASLFRCIAVAS